MSRRQMIYLTCRVRGRPLASFRSEIAGAASGAVRWNPPDLYRLVGQACVSFLG
jgi:hypothetical protein